MARKQRNEYLERLASVSLFRGLDDDELEIVAGLGTEVPVAAGQALTTEGQNAHEAFLVMEGTATCTKGGEVVAEFGPGDFFGEMALIAHRPRSASVRAGEGLVVRTFEEAEFRRMLHDSPAVAVKILLATAERLLNAEAEPTH